VKKCIILIETSKVWQVLRPLAVPCLSPVQGGTKLRDKLD